MGEGVIRYRDRATGAVRVERVFGERALRFLHVSPWGRMLGDLVFRQPATNWLYGWWQRSSLSRADIARFVRELDIDAAEAERPLSDYRSMDEFFTRKLKAGARTIHPDPARLVSPADGRVLVYPRVGDGAFDVKGCRVTLPVLLGSRAVAERFRDGAAVVVRLAPPDYHRFHFPDGGVAGPAREIGWHLHSVNPIALEAGAPSFRNKRMITLLESRGFGTLALIEVGAMGVGTIVQTYRPGAVDRGQEKGTFRFGGSTVVMLAEPGRITFDEDLLAASGMGMESLLRMGEGIATKA